jgi:hypothetical protein
MGFSMTYTEYFLMLLGVFSFVVAFLSKWLNFSAVMVGGISVVFNLLCVIYFAHKFMESL